MVPQRGGGYTLIAWDSETMKEKARGREKREKKKTVRLNVMCCATI